ncbi:MAG: tRNA pseudouridine(38-40) synthase TruA [Methanobacteriaceae archaeon]|nr:tRNA pseudouridine(38-40) synthase TruA [Candidatus Methanorudis spinitermitis]
MKKIALKIAYIGTHFNGFQRQPNLRTIEGEIISVLEKLGYIHDLKKSKFQIAGRTDKGVHSLGNVISFITDKKILINQINHCLPDDIQILAKAPVRYGFKPRYALMKHYRYMFFEENLNISAMEKLSKLFLGEHDFTNFSKRDQKTPVRKIDDINIITGKNKKNNDIIKYKPIMGQSIKYKLGNNKKLANDFNEFVNKDVAIDNHEESMRIFNEYDQFNQQGMDNFNSIFVDVYGESFLWNMIRKMMRIFLLVGKNKIDLDEARKFLNPKEKFNIKPLESENLILMDISYNNINFKYDNYACEGFRRYLIDNLFNYKMNHSIDNNILNSMEKILSNNNYLNNDKD